MSENAAPEEKLGSLHSLIADTLIEQLAGTPVQDMETGEIIGREIDPRIISAAISFLRDNKITKNPFLDEKISEIEERLRTRKKRFKVVTSEDAAQRAANDA